MRSPNSGRKPGTPNRIVRGGRHFTRPSLQVKGTVSSSYFNAYDAMHAVSDGVLELRGTAVQAPRFPGLVSATLTGARVIR